MQCSRCHAEMDHRFGRHGAFWSCPNCHRTCNEDGSNANWGQIISNHIAEFHKNCADYQNTIVQDIPIGADPISSLILIQKCQHEFDTKCATTHYQLSTFQHRPDLQPYFDDMNSSYAVTYWRLAEACLRIGRYHDAAKYIPVAIRYIGVQHPDRQSIFNTQSEILARTSALASTEQAPLPLPAPEQSATSNPSQSPASPTAASPSKPSENLGGCCGCLKYFLISFLVVIFFIYLASCGQERAKPHPFAPPAASQSVIPSSSSNASEDPAYVGNKKSKIFHWSTCGSASRISESNYKEFDSREDAIQSGYKPCKKCNP